MLGFGTFLNMRCINGGLGGVWPPTGIETFDPWHLPLINTLILLCSGAAATWAHHAIAHENDRKGLENGLILAIGLGALFTVFQIYEYTHASFAFSGNIYGASFFMATGFHGFHVLIGTIFLLVCLIRAKKGHFLLKSILALKQRLGIGISLMSFGCFFLLQFTFGELSRFQDLLKMNKKWLFVVFIAIPGLLVLLSLGVWQTKRLAWKEALLENIKNNLTAEPSLLTSGVKKSSHNYKMVKVQGVLEPKSIFILTPIKGLGAGFRVISPLKLEGGSKILVDRGVIKEREKPRLQTLANRGR